MTYNFLRIDRDSIIKLPRKTLGAGEGPLYLFFGAEEDPDEKPLIVGGEIADGLRMWISGAKTFPVTAGGILDLYSVLVDGHTAQRAFNNAPLDDLSSVILDANNYKDQQSGPKPSNSPVGVIDVDAVARGIKSRK